MLQGQQTITLNIAKMRARMIAEAHAAADETGIYLANRAKQIAPWTDRTGHLRQEIAYRVESSSASIVVHIFHSREYGPFVEAGTRRSRPYPSLWPAIASSTLPVAGIFRRHLKL